MRLFSKIFFIIIIISAFSVDSYSIVLHRDKRNKMRSNKTRPDDFNKKDFNKKDYNPDQKSSKRRVKLSKKFKPKMIIFNFENFTNNPKNNYLVKLSAPSLTKNLKKSRKFNAEHVDIYFASVKIDDYSKYIKLLKKTANRYNADYVITGFVHKPSGGVSIECLIYVSRSNSILKVSANGDNLGLEYNDMIDELARKILGILNKENKKLREEGGGTYSPGKFKYEEGKYSYIGMTGYFNLFYAHKLSRSIGYMASGMIYWELASIKKVRQITVLRDMALFWSLDVGRILAQFDVLNQGSNSGPAYHHFWGGVMGLMYKLKIKFFVLDFALGYGPMYSVTILATNYLGVRSFLKPEPALSTSTDHYFTMRFNFNIMINQHCLFSFGLSYHLISLEPQLFNALAGSAGVGFKF